jgi:two-component system response regulator NreC
MQEIGMKKICILIADDHPIVREGLRQLLETQPDIKVVGEAGDGIEALERARELVPDVVLLDIAMPRMSGLEAVRLIREAVPETRIVVLSMYEKEAYAHQVIEAGAHGYVLKGEPSSEMLAAIRAACADRYYFSSKVHADVIRGYIGGRPHAETSKGFDSLSERERQIFFLLIEGNTSPQIGKILCLSVKTVEKHRASICRKIGTSSPLEMMKYAIRWGIIDPDFWKT